MPRLSKSGRTPDRRISGRRIPWVKAIRFACTATVSLLPLSGIAAQKTDEIVFAAWNVRNYHIAPAGRAADEGGSGTTKSAESLDALVDILRSINPDILGLSEMGTRRDLADLQRRLAGAGVSLPHSTLVNAADQERRLALLSRFPLTRIKHDTRSTFVLDGTTHRARRGFLDCTVIIRPDFSLRILGAHLKSRRFVPEFDQAEFRRSEAVLLRAKLEKIQKEDPATKLLLFGDFNDTKNSPTIRTLLGHRGSPEALEALPLSDHLGDQWTYHRAETDEYSRIDYVMVSRALRPLVRKKGTGIHRSPRWYEASDHRPLVVRIKIPAKSPLP
jgi:endonuclease/exonuclease/phosphatase family metal-dependent hydrolase